jgi:hypothetical protein
MNIDDFFLDIVDDDKQPSYDIAICSECQWKGPVSECEEGREGDWESGYYAIDLCPICEDGGCVDDYTYSEEQLEEYYKWKERNENTTIRVNNNSQ